MLSHVNIVMLMGIDVNTICIVTISMYYLISKEVGQDDHNLFISDCYYDGLFGRNVVFVTCTVVYVVKCHMCAIKYYVIT